MQNRHIQREEDDFGADNDIPINSNNQAIGMPH
jgi:hypothetical protein